MATLNQKLLSIGIPTYNRADSLKALLDNIIPQVLEFRNRVEVCISNNASSDNTEEIIMKFNGKYPDLINYNKNQENLGFDRNFLRVTNMAKGDFLWFLGDDNYISSDGLEEVIGLLESADREKIGFVSVGFSAHIQNQPTGEKDFYFTSLDKDKPEVFRIDRRYIVAGQFAGGAFISAQIFNNRLLKKMFQEDQTMIEAGIGTGYINVILNSLMFLKYPAIEALMLNKQIVYEPLPHYKLVVEDKFSLHYVSQKKINQLLLSSKYMNDKYIPLFVEKDKKLRRNFIIEMCLMKAFGSFNYFSFQKCIKMFFNQAILIDGLLFSVFFLFFLIIPSNILKTIYKTIFKAKHKKDWEKHWFYLTATYELVDRGERRIATY